MAYVEGIFIASGEGMPPAEIAEARAVAGRGLDGDRYFLQTGRFSGNEGFRQLTLMEAEAVEALERDYKIDLQPGQMRRNLITRGIALNHFVGRELQIGEVRIRGRKLCEPCTYLESLTKDGIRRGMVHRGGLRADILTDGVIRKGDTIVTTNSDQADVTS